jgi:hypothetical protein
MGKVIDFGSKRVIELEMERNRLIKITQELALLNNQQDLEYDILLTENINSINNTITYLESQLIFNLKSEHSLKHVPKN